MNVSSFETKAEHYTILKKMMVTSLLLFTCFLVEIQELDVRYVSSSENDVGVESPSIY